MLAYIQKIYNRRQAQVNGIAANEGQWGGQPDTVDLLKQDLELLTAKDKHISDLKQQLSEAQKEARLLCAQIDEKADQTENRVKGIHAAELHKWGEYGVQSERSYAVRESPTKPLTLTIKDDTDGQGFILTLFESDDAADFYIWEKGDSPDSKATVPTKWEYMIQTTKGKYLDDNVLPGVRYFYRVRAGNPNGLGRWSNEVNRVQ